MSVPCPGRLRSRQSRWPAAECGLAFSDGEYPTNMPCSPLLRNFTVREGPGCIDVSASAAVEDAEDQRHAVTYLSDEGDGAAALHGARRSPRGLLDKLRHITRVGNKGCVGA